MHVPADPGWGRRFAAAVVVIAKKAHPIRFHIRATAAITQYQRGTDDFVSWFILVFLRFWIVGRQSSSLFNQASVSLTSGGIIELNDVSKRHVSRRVGR